MVGGTKVGQSLDERRAEDLLRASSTEITLKIGLWIGLWKGIEICFIIQCMARNAFCVLHNGI